MVSLKYIPSFIFYVAGSETSETTFMHIWRFVICQKILIISVHCRCLSLYSLQSQQNFSCPAHMLIS